MKVSQDRSSYRRGIMLGLTMAEIIILIVFLLLLGFAALIKEERDKHADQLSFLNDNKKQIDRVIKVFSQNPPDMNADIVRIVEKLPEQISLLKQENKDNKENPVSEDISAAISKYIETQSVSNKISEKPIEQQLVDSLIIQKTLESQNKNLQDQKKSLIKQIEDSGRGVDWPPCWPDKDGRASEFIFKVDLTNEGIYLYDSAPAHRGEEKKLLPMSGIVYSKPRSTSQFQNETAPLYDWSQSNECRFYVVIYDKTGADQKALFKKLLSTVEGAFYKKLIQSKTTVNNVRVEPEPVAPQPEQKKNNSSFWNFIKGGSSAESERYN